MDVEKGTLQKTLNSTMYMQTYCFILNPINKLFPTFLYPQIKIETFVTPERFVKVNIVQ